MGLFPEPYTVAHIARSEDGPVDPDTGNPIQLAQTAVIRKVQAISQVGRIRGSSIDVMSPEFIQRVRTDLHLTVSDPMVYGNMDQVLLFPSLDSEGNYVAGTGIAFWVDGLPMDQSLSPWPTFFKVFGGLIRVRRAG